MLVIAAKHQANCPLQMRDKALKKQGLARRKVRMPDVTLKGNLD